MRRLAARLCLNCGFPFKPRTTRRCPRCGTSTEGKHR